MFWWRGGCIAVDATEHVFGARGRASVVDGDLLYWDADEPLSKDSFVTISNSTISNNTSIGAAGGGLSVVSPAL